ncbi:HEAT repeat domain-containing protein [Sorangium sp. So ce1182]|uniref:HEAT repeat domain-containing protein n=1 Tax=Sorangium sp. So ce1182 TaxID=3133334 RepID=UPI003F623859
MTSRRPPLALSEPERQRVEQVDRLAASGSPGVPGLIEMLADPSWSVRRAVVASLAALGGAAVQALCDSLGARRDSEARIAATVDALVASLADVDGPVLALTRDPRAAIVADAAQILGRRGSTGAVSRLAELTSHDDDNVAVAAIEALGRVGGRAAVDSLVGAVTSGNFFRVFPAIDVLGRSGDPRAIGPLSSLLDDPRYLLEAARALGRTGSRSAVAPLVRLIGRPSDAVARVAAVALAELRERYRERYGTAEPIDEALRSEVLAPGAARRLSHSLAGSDPGEQAMICSVLGAIGGEDVLLELTRLLDAEPPVASAAADALGRLSRSADTRVLAALRDGDSARRLLLLPLVRGAAAAADVEGCLADPDPEVRAAACDALGRIAEPRSARALFPLLDDPNPRVVHAAMTAIQCLGGADVEALALSAAREGTPSMRRSALRILAYFAPPSALPIFIDGLRDPDLRVRERAIHGLASCAEPGAIEALVAVAADPSGRVRAVAMRALGQTSQRDARVIEALLAGLRDDDAWVRYYACQSLGKLGWEAAAGAIAERLRDESGQVRVAAVEALSGIKGDLALAALEAAARESDTDMRRSALIGLGIAGREESLPTLLGALSSPDVATRLVGVSAVSGFSSPEVLPVLVRAAGDADESVRAAATSFIAGRPGVEATRSLIALLVSSRAPAPLLAALATPLPGRIDGILEALATADDELAPLLTAALARMRLPEAHAALLEALRLPRAPARKAAATTLAAVATREAFAAVEHASRTDPDPEVRRVSASVLSQWV